MKKITRCQKRSFQVVLLDLTVISCNILTIPGLKGIGLKI